MELDEIRTISNGLKTEVRRTIIGQEGALDLMLVSLLCKGHLLLEGVPGTGKTLLVRSFSKALNLDFGRIQFTPDLMPGDVLGTNLFNFQTNEFSLTKGPIFTDLLLADEINRTPPKTQSALLEAMSERTVTIDGTSHNLGEGFLVIATQNPIEQQGTYPLPEAQLDRFMFKYVLEYPSEAEERSIVTRHGHQTSMPKLDEFGVQGVADLAKLEEMRAVVSAVKLSDEIVNYIVSVVRGTREHPSLQFGGSPRSATMLAAASRAYAALQGRDYVIPDDVKFIAIPGLHHRVVLSPSAEIEGIRTTSVINEILEQTAAPR
ncbi:AAA family ATPase [Kiloniella antarctica]|uniref:AAA family ATPase n=1 Tax=Kiloniella antarctica TaxID=1550907 RepID=A0ABW5BKT7_9PROT